MLKLSAKRVAIIVGWAGTMTVALGAGAYGHKYRAQIRALVASVQNDPAITTNLYTLRVEKMQLPAEGRDGGIAALGDGTLFVSRTGEFWFIDEARVPHALTPRAPINLQEFLDDPFNEKTLYPELFSVKDIAVQETAAGLRVLVSHSHWNRAERCNTMRLSSLETTQEALLAGRAGSDWRLLYETAPCRPLEKAGDGVRMGLGMGGRVAPLADGNLLISVGGFDPENELVLLAPQKLDNSYGKTIWIDPVSGANRIFSVGHRNPQGLGVGPNGDVWLTEHGPRGGDELNRLENGGNYGYPHVVYGTQYDQMEWPLSKVQGRHEGFDKPMFAWTPSVGISQVLVPRRGAFPHWQGDVLVSSLGAQSVFRVRVEDDRVILVEPILIGHRIRDIIEAEDGAIVLKTDDNFLVYVSPLNASTAATALERGALLAAQCQSCHSMTEGGTAAIGPALWGVVGRSVADKHDFNYTPALRGVGGRWTAERLRDFLQNPQAFAPGTTMQLGSSLTAAQLDDLITYLETLK